jgi:uncharacterized protein YqgC (DUF456 family)
MIELSLIIAISILVLLTIGSFFPFVPSGILSSLTVLVYWWQTGYASPNAIIVASLVILGLIVTVTDFASGAIAGKIGGASDISVILGSVSGVILLFVLGPIGFIIGIASTVFLFSIYQDNDDVKIATKKSIYTVIGVLASKLVQLLLLSVLTLTFTFFTFV